MSRLSQFAITVLLVDDQAIIAEAVRRMLANQPDLTFHHCSDPTQALTVAGQVKPTVILQDLIMPDVDGLTLVKFFRANPATREVPIIVLSTKEDAAVKAESFAVGANDYVVKLPDRVELAARVRYHSKGYIATLERNEAYAALQESQTQLAAQVDAAARYVRSLLPDPMNGSPEVDWRYVPCAQLGGDTFGYHWLDEDHFAFYLIDVTGHGLDSALFSVTVMNVLRSSALPNTDFRNPGQVLNALNESFQMDQYGDKYFTIWYGVYHRPTSRLIWSGGGHPAVLLFEPGSLRPRELESQGPAVGMMPWPEFEVSEQAIAPHSRILLFSDGVQEIAKPDGSTWSMEEFMGFVTHPPAADRSVMDQLYDFVRALRGSDLLDDDFTIIEATF